MSVRFSPPLDPFEDDLTRELPSALRTFTDLAPLTPELSSEILEVAAILDDVEERGHHGIAEHTVRIPRPPSVPAFALDVEAARGRAPSAWDHPLALMIAAALLIACSLAGAIGIVAGRALSASEPMAGARQPRIAVVAAAREVITLSALTAPEKEVVLPPAPPPPVARPIVRVSPAAPARASAPAPASSSAAGRRHLGSDRDPSRDRGTTTPRR